MTVRRLEEPCRQCGSPVYQLGTDAPKCSHCGLCPPLRWSDGVVPQPPVGRGTGFTQWDAAADDAPMVTPARDRWRSAGLQLAVTFLALAAILLLAAIGLALPPRLMLAVGFAVIVTGAVAGIWLAAGELVAEWKRRKD